jgi:hypothetical protein
MPQTRTPIERIIMILTMQPGASDWERVPVPPAFLTLEWLQKMVDGLVEKVTLRYGERDIDLLCNEEGLLLNLPPTVCLLDGVGRIHTVLYGPLVVVAASAHGEWVPLTGEEAQEVFAMMSNQWLVSEKLNAALPMLQPESWKSVK